jgi:hypothetical protein
MPIRSAIRRRNNFRISKLLSYLRGLWDRVLVKNDLAAPGPVITGQLQD